MAANRFFASRIMVIDGPPLLRSNSGQRIVWWEPDRYYGPGYEVGSWPHIHAAIVLLRAALPGCQVFYGGDHDPDGQEVTDELLAGLWAHFLGPYGARRGLTPP